MLLYVCDVMYVFPYPLALEGRKQVYDFDPPIPDGLYLQVRISWGSTEQTQSLALGAVMVKGVL